MTLNDERVGVIILTKSCDNQRIPEILLFERPDLVNVYGIVTESILPSDFRLECVANRIMHKCTNGYVTNVGDKWSSISLEDMLFYILEIGDVEVPTFLKRIQDNATRSDIRTGTSTKSKSYTKTRQISLESRGLLSIDDETDFTVEAPTLKIMSALLRLFYKNLTLTQNDTK
jgi:hypothetical protein